MPRRSQKTLKGRPAIFDQVKMRDMTLHGASAKEIAETLGCDPAYVFNWRCRKWVTNQYEWRRKV
jgi:uncharacterized protein YjcR